MGFRDDFDDAGTAGGHAPPPRHCVFTQGNNGKTAHTHAKKLFDRALVDGTIIELDGHMFARAKHDEISRTLENYNGSTIIIDGIYGVGENARALASAIVQAVDATESPSILLTGAPQIGRAHV